MLQFYKNITVAEAATAAIAAAAAAAIAAAAIAAATVEAARKPYRRHIQYITPR